MFPLTPLFPLGTWWAIEEMDAMQLSGRTALVTGGTSGIGLELVRLLVGRGNMVLVTGRDPARLEAVRRELPGWTSTKATSATPLRSPASMSR